MSSQHQQENLPPQQTEQAEQSVPITQRLLALSRRQSKKQGPKAPKQDKVMKADPRTVKQDEIVAKPNDTAPKPTPLVTNIPADHFTKFQSQPSQQLQQPPSPQKHAEQQQDHKASVATGSSGSTGTATPVTPGAATSKAYPESGSPSPHAGQGNNQAAANNAARPRRRNRPINTAETRARLNRICEHGDPNSRYVNLTKVGQGATGGVFTANEAVTNRCVAIKQMDLELQPKQDLIVNEILVMKESRHKNIVNFMGSYLHRGNLWVVMEYMEGGSLTDVVTYTIMSEPQIATVCREVCNQPLEHQVRFQLLTRL